jgi:hypothetical protein
MPQTCDKKLTEHSLHPFTRQTRDCLYRDADETLCLGSYSTDKYSAVYARSTHSTCSGIANVPLTAQLLTVVEQHVLGTETIYCQFQVLSLSQLAYVA